MLYPLNALYHVQQQFSGHLREKVYIVWSKGGMYSNSKVHGANMGPIWGRQDPGGPHVGPMNFAIWVCHWTGRVKIWCVCVAFTWTEKWNKIKLHMPSFVRTSIVFSIIVMNKLILWYTNHCKWHKHIYLRFWSCSSLAQVVAISDQQSGRHTSS